ncbi:TfoX/Sxy family protein [Halorubellus salinus]|uniref:TfoX/Sxy family protein n=1 Tax=Halorubellus salinus TaxID=755309 RepID=UPI001D0660EB|nr:TfoX/Sxy family protein [Halorubellus salinus]
MTYDDGLAHRVRETLGDRHGLTEKELFGGIAFMLEGNVVCGVADDAFVARVGADAYDDALAEPHAREMDFTGRPMTGMVFVDPPGIASDDALGSWVDRCLAHAESLPAK